ncbi:MAG: flavin reductase family protein [Filomicrobium sp.]
MNIASGPDETLPGLESADYRQLMRHQAAGVAIVATGAVGARVGLTATSVASLSDAPPKVLVCIGRKNRAHNVVVDEGSFSINFLALNQRDLAEIFSGKRGINNEDRFAHGTWEVMKTGAPVLGGAITSLDCQLMESHTFTTHSIFIGRVVDGQRDASAQPLIYFDGAYRNLASDSTDH